MARPSTAIEFIARRAVAFVLAMCSTVQVGRLDAAEKAAFEIGWSQLAPLAGTPGATRSRLSVLGDMLVAFPRDTLESPVKGLDGPAGTWRELTFIHQESRARCLSAVQREAILIPCREGLVCLGGIASDPRGTPACLLRDSARGLATEELPQLPVSLSTACGAATGSAIYVAGRDAQRSGRETSFYTLDLARPRKSRAWQVLDSWPETGTIAAALIAQADALLVFGEPGDGRSGTAPGLTVSRFDLRTGWSTMAATAWAPLRPSAVPIGPAHVLVADAESASSAGLYHAVTDTWLRLDLHHQPQTLTAWRRGFAILNEEGLWFGEFAPLRSSRTLSLIDRVLLLSYLLALAVIGMAVARRRRAGDDFFLAGRRIPWWAAGMSLFGTSISAITFLAIPALVYRTNWVYYLGNVMILAVAPVVIRCYLPFYRRLEVVSAYEYLELRFGLPTRLLGSATFLLYQLSRLGVIIYLPALAMSTMTGWSVTYSIVVIGVVVSLYTFLGGIEAVVWTDVLQVLVFVGGAIVSLAVILSRLSDRAAGEFQQALASGKLDVINLNGSAADAVLWVVIFGNFFKFLIPYSSDQSVIQHYLTTRDEKQAARSIWLNAAASVPIWLLFFALGTSLWAFYRVHPDRLNPAGRTDEIFAWFMVHELPPGAIGLVLAGLLAASMSTLDGGLNSMSTALTTDFYLRLRPAAGNRERLWAARSAIVLFGAASTTMAAYMASSELESAWDQIMKFVGLFGGGLGGLFVAGIFTRRIQQAAALTGFAASSALLAYVHTTGTAHFFLYGAIGLLACPLVGYAVSLMLPACDRNLGGLTIYTMTAKQRHANSVQHAHDITDGKDCADFPECDGTVTNR